MHKKIPFFVLHIFWCIFRIALFILSKLLSYPALFLIFPEYAEQKGQAPNKTEYSQTKQVRKSPFSPIWKQ